ncbi:MAG: hypothetical protein VYB28_01095 [Gemmatimonadota bacterium]|nr:hypothetical protein [Gemmatimonadota bacterium]
MVRKYEVERRFLVQAEAGLLTKYGEGRRLKQAYLLSGKQSLRIRIGEERGAVLTAKSGTGIRRLETEVVVPNNIAEALFLKADQGMIEKLRWYIGPWELDQFLGRLSGLFLLEIELESDGDKLPGAFPDGVTVIREVTSDNRFTSSSLAGLPTSNRSNFVQSAYREAGTS